MEAHCHRIGILSADQDRVLDVDGLPPLKKRQSASSAPEFSRRATHGLDADKLSPHRRNAGVCMDTKSEFMAKTKLVDVPL